MIGRGNNGEREKSMRRGAGGTGIGNGIEEEEEQEEEVTTIREGGTMTTTGEEEAGRGIRTTTDRGIVIHRRGGGRGVRTLFSEGGRRRLAVTSIRGGVSSVLCKVRAFFDPYICTSGH